MRIIRARDSAQAELSGCATARSYYLPRRLDARPEAANLRLLIDPGIALAALRELARLLDDAFSARSASVEPTTYISSVGGEAS
jgi:hypothetical protein